MSLKDPIEPDEPEIREHLSEGVNRSQLGREVKRAVGPAALVLALIAVAAVLLVVIARNTSGGRSPLAGQYEIQADVADASGVVAGQHEVRISGLRVGRITRSRLVDGQAVLTLKIAKKYGPVYRNARLRLRPTTPLNDLYLDIVDRGSPRAGKAGKDTVLPVTATSVPVQFSQALNVFRPVTRQRMQHFVEQFGPALDDHGQQLRAAFVELSPFLTAAKRLTTQLAQRRTQTRRVVHNLGTMLDELADRDSSLRGLVRHGATTMTALGDSHDPLNQTLQEFPQVVGQARSTFTTLPPVLKRARGAFDALGPVAKTLPGSMDALTAFSGDATPAFSALQPTVSRLDGLFAQARPLAKTLAQALAGLRPSAPRLDTITKLVDGCRTPLGQFFMDTLSVFKFSEAHNSIPRGELVANNPGDLMTPPSCAPGRPRK